MKTRLTTRFLWASTAFWLIAISGGMAMVLGHSGAPGIPAVAPVDWPAHSHVPAPHDRPVLVIALHPQCACSQATLSELEQLLAGRADRMSVEILVCCPNGAPSKWMDTSLTRRAATIPGAHVIVDKDNVEAVRFGAKTSGQTFLFDSHGRRLFSGGITDGRGHEGNNPGVEMIEALVDGKAPAVPATGFTTPVFGCSLFSESGSSIR